MPRFADLVTMLRLSVEKYGPRDFLGTRAGGRWSWVTYSQFAAAVDEARAGLAGLGVARGDAVAIIAANSVEWAVACHATYGLGAAWVPMYPAQRDEDWRHILADAGACVAFVGDAATRARIEALRPSLPSLAHVIALDGATDDPASFASLRAAGSRAPLPPVTPAPDEVANLIYTSGTTGRPKGVRLTHGNLAGNVDAVMNILPFVECERSLAFLPWAHVFGGSVELHGMTAIGGALALCPSVEKLVEELGDVKPTVMFAVPLVWQRLHDGVRRQLAQKPRAVRLLVDAALAAARKGREGRRLTVAERLVLALADRLVFAKVRARLGGRLKYACSGAAALSKDVAEFIDSLGILVYEGYGMTETSGVALCNRPSQRRIGSVGVPIPGVRVELDKTAPGSDGDSGEILVFGHNVMAGYHHLDDETKRVTTDGGGLRTGDLGRIDADGFVYITGRAKELYKLENGKYVAPVPIEEKLVASPFVSQVMVTGEDRPYNVAVIVPDLVAVADWAAGKGLAGAAPDALCRHDELRRLIEGELDKHLVDVRAYERPRKFLLVPEAFSTANGLLTPTMKVKRRDVLKRYGGELASLYR